MEPSPGRPGSAGGLASGLTAVLAWGLSPVATRALVQQLAPLPVLVLRVMIAAVVLVPLCVPLLRRFAWSSAPRMAAAGLLGMVGYNLPVTIGLAWVPASTAVLLLATEPIWILLLSRVFLGERVPRWSWGGAGVAAAGVAVLAGPGVLAGGSGRALAGIGLVLLGTALFGAYTIVLRPLSDQYGAVPAAATSTLAGALPYLALAGMLAPARIGRLPAAAWGELAFTGLVATVAGLLLWSVAVARIGPARTGLLLYLEPVAGVSGAAVLLRERLSAGLAAGGVLVMAGVIVAWRAHGLAPGGPRAGQEPEAVAPLPGGSGSDRPQAPGYETNR
ncbi:MAG TPA: DMT family transporter [Streptosporangiaceae bacterium]|jgi:drug/metabolite transporter (DMT)-like permease